MDTKITPTTDPPTYDLSHFEEEIQSPTIIDIANLNLTSLKAIKQQFYAMSESANRLGMGIRVENLDLISPSGSGCTHFMQSCNRETSAHSDLYMILQSIVSSTGGRRTHWIKLSAE